MARGNGNGKVTLQQRHFQFIADTLKGLLLDENTKKYVITEFARALRGTNENFKESKFLDAAGYPKEVIFKD